MRKLKFFKLALIVLALVTIPGCTKEESPKKDTKQEKKHKDNDGHEHKEGDGHTH